MSSITANEYRTAAKVDRFHGGQSAAQFYEDNARALESEDLVTQVAMQFAGSTWGGRDAEEQFALAGSERALAYLVGAGRLIPAGGMALTAEEGYLAGKVMAALCTRNGYFGDPLGLVDALKFLESALFPATEPAAVRDGSDLVVVQRSHTAKAVQSWMTLDLWTDLGKNDNDFDAEYERQGFGDLWATLLGEVRALVQATTPAPAEPAEEETKAETHIEALRDLFNGGPDTAIRTTWHDSVEYWEVPADDMRTMLTSSPVVPAPTETEWATWQEVPEGQTVQAANGERFRKTGVGAIHLLTNGVGDCCKISTATDLLPAPFVAAEEG